VDLLAPWGLSGVTVTPAEHGTNNGTYLAGDRWVLRITQNLSLAQVRAEHRLLRRLGQAGLPFAVPVPVPAVSGDTVVPTESGPAVVCELIPGVRPDLSACAALERAGRAFGLLDRALAEVPPADSPHDWAAEPLRPDPELYADLSSAGLDVGRLRAWCPVVSGLPVQVVHGDLGAGNMLVSAATGEVTGILDFEIAGTSFRVDELVAGLALTCVPGDLGRAAALVRGYRSAIPLTEAELLAVPDLLIARAVGSALWRSARWRRGQATLDEVRDRLSGLDAIQRWVEAARDELLETLLSPGGKWS
jgi:homoserine kinase type II